MERLPRSFYARHPLVVARDLLGRRLVRVWRAEESKQSLTGWASGQVERRLSGRIVEVEAYTGRDDAASHARCGPTGRNAPMFGPPGHAYIYLIYGLHWMFNVVAHQADAGAVLVRAMQPKEGLDLMRRNRKGRPDRQLTNGPAKLAQALGITGALTGVDLCQHPDIFIEPGEPVPDEMIVRGPRVGVTGDELAKRRPWRLTLVTPRCDQ